MCDWALSRTSRDKKGHARKHDLPSTRRSLRGAQGKVFWIFVGLDGVVQRCVVVKLKQLMEQSTEQFDEECRSKFQRRSPLCVQNETHNESWQTELHSFSAAVAD